MRAALTAIIINADDASCCTSYAQVSSSVDVAALSDTTGARRICILSPDHMGRAGGRGRGRKKGGGTRERDEIKRRR